MNTKELPRLHTNLKYLAMANGIKIADLEKEMNVSNGYISRGKGLSLMSVYRASKILNVSMEDLIENNCPKALAITAIQIEIYRLKEELEELQNEHQTESTGA